MSMFQYVVQTIIVKSRKIQTNVFAGKISKIDTYEMVSSEYLQETLP